MAGSTAWARTAVLLLPPALAVLAPSGAGPAAPVLALVAPVAWALTAWLWVVVLLAGLSRLPGLTGAAAAALARRLVPAGARVLLRTLTGLTVAGSALGGTAWADTDPGLTVVVTSAAPVPSPVLAPPLPSPTPAVTPSVAGPDWPTSQPWWHQLAPDLPRALQALPRPAAAPARPAHPGPTPVTAVRPTAAPTAAVPPALPRPENAEPAPQDRPDGTRHVVVRPGDSLWAIAAADLGPAATPARVAQAWPQWWSANRALVGDDPDLLHPGTALADPTP